MKGNEGPGIGGLLESFCSSLTMGIWPMGHMPIAWGHSRYSVSGHSLYQHHWLLLLIVSTGDLNLLPPRDTQSHPIPIPLKVPKCYIHQRWCFFYMLCIRKCLSTLGLLKCKVLFFANLTEELCNFNFSTEFRHPKSYHSVEDRNRQLNYIKDIRERFKKRCFWANFQQIFLAEFFRDPGFWTLPLLLLNHYTSILCVLDGIGRGPKR